MNRQCSQGSLSRDNKLILLDILYQCILLVTRVSMMRDVKIYTYILIRYIDIYKCFNIDILIYIKYIHVY